MEPTIAAPVSSSTPQSSRYSVVNLPLCFVCAKVEEYHEVQTTLKKQKDVIIEHTDFFYEEKSFTVGIIEAEKRTVRFFLTHGADQGPESFGIFSSRLFSIFKPQAAVLLGTCAARKSNDYDLADVAFGHSAYNYEEGKYMDEKTFNADFLRRKSDLAKTQIGGFLSRKPDHYHEAIFLTGSAVRQDAKMIFEKWKEPRHADVVEMEASAFFNSCEHCHVAALGVVKGVSDYGDVDKDSNNSIDYRTALSRATRAALDLCKYYCNGASFTQVPKAACFTNS
jgi:nucleoside phosphorylase